MQAGVTFGLSYPGAQCLRCHTELCGDRGDCSPLRSVLRCVVENHAHRPFLQLRWISLSCIHGSLLSDYGASRKPGAVPFELSLEPFCVVDLSPLSLSLIMLLDFI